MQTPSRRFYKYIEIQCYDIFVVFSSFPFSISCHVLHICCTFVHQPPHFGGQMASMRGCRQKDYLTTQDHHNDHHDPAKKKNNVLVAKIRKYGILSRKYTNAAFFVTKI